MITSFLASPVHCCSIKKTHESDLCRPQSRLLSASSHLSSLYAVSSSTDSVVTEELASLFIGRSVRSPVVFVEGKGSFLYDTEGKGYLDLTAGSTGNSLGHGDPQWVSAFTKQAGRLAHISNRYYNFPQNELAKRLMSSSFAEHVFLTNSGAEAIEASIKFSRKYQRVMNPKERKPATEFMSFKNSFHGRTMGALALTSKEHSNVPCEAVMPGAISVEFGDFEAAKQLIRPGQIAAVFVEPIQGKGGVYSATKEFLQTLRDACDDAGALLVFDEVECGVGRTGYMWAHEAYGVFPDIMTLGKTLAGGLPIGAVLTTQKVSSAISYGDHGSTFAGGPLICNVADTVVDILQKPGFLVTVSNKGIYLKELLLRKLGGNPHVKCVRGVGLLIGIEFDVSVSSLVDACQTSGLLVLSAGKGNVIRLLPSLTISENELEQVVDILSECISSL